MVMIFGICDDNISAGINTNISTLISNDNTNIIVLITLELYKGWHNNTNQINIILTRIT